MAKYKVNIDKKPVPDAVIDKHKNFDGLMSELKKVHDVRHATKPLFRDRKLLSFLILVFIVLMALILADDKKSKKDKGEKGKDKIENINNSPGNAP